MRPDDRWLREQTHSNLIRLHIVDGAGLTADRLTAYAGRVGARMADPAVAAAQASKLLSSSVVVQANVLAYADGFSAAAIGAFGCLVLIALMRRGPPSAF